MKLLLLAAVCFVLGSCTAQDDPVFDVRSSRLLEVVSAENEVSPYVIAAKVRTGRDLAGACLLLDSLTRDRAMGGMFYAYSLIGAYLFTRDALPDSLHAKVRLAFRDRTMYRGDTENHWVMYYTGLYLAAQTWPGEGRDTWFNGKSSEENFQEAAEWLGHWMTTSATIGQGEFDSPTYITTFLTPMIVLHEFAEDPVMKKRAGMMLDLLFADFAAEHLEGNYGGGHSRDYPEDIINPLGAPSTMWAWLYFGKPEFEQWEEARFRPRNRGGWETAFGALGSYRLPPMIRSIATDRSEPYVHTETKRVRNVIRLGTEKNPPVYKYTYVTSDYILGSLHGGILQPIQQHTWDVTFASGRPNNTIFTLHPYASGKELAMFFPEEIKFLADEVDRYHLVYTSPDKWNSSSPYERTFQHRNTLIVLYNIKEGEMHPHIDGFFPKNLDERMESAGWILCRAGKVYVALHPVRRGQWIEETVNWRWRSHQLKNGVIVEVGSEREDGSWEAFRTSLATTRLDTSAFNTTLSLSYRNRQGVDLRFSFDGTRMVNGKEIHLTDYGFFEGPFLQSERGSGRITMRYKGRSRTLDFNTTEIME
ncbi:MAG: hypothetical protein HBSIN02_05020 [Bacteroidia bacterium]|nr:MAG: hypothetical protein HBSIN02_05020 [Bacteroidia bacterium]